MGFRPMPPMFHNTVGLRKCGQASIRRVVGVAQPSSQVVRTPKGSAITFPIPAAPKNTGPYFDGPVRDTEVVGCNLPLGGCSRGNASERPTTPQTMTDFGFVWVSSFWTGESTPSIRGWFGCCALVCSGFFESAIRVLWSTD